MANATVLTNQGKTLIANRIKGTGAEPLYVGFGTGGGARTAVAGDVYSTMTQSGSRSLGNSTIVTTTVTNDTHQVVAIYNATGTVIINEIMSFDASTIGNSFISATITGVALNNGDSLTATIKLKAA